MPACRLTAHNSLVPGHLVLSLLLPVAGVTDGRHDGMLHQTVGPGEFAAVAGGKPSGAVA